MEKSEKYTQICVWEATLVRNSETDIDKQNQRESEFVKWMLEELNVRVKYIDEVITEPDIDQNGKFIKNTGGRNDLFFYIHSDDIEKFALIRLSYGIRWWEDIVGNNSHQIYPEKFLNEFLEKQTW